MPLNAAKKRAIKRYAVNPDVTGDVLVVGAVLVAAYFIIQNLPKIPELPQLPTAPGFGQPIVLPYGTGYVSPNPFQFNLPGSFKSLDQLNADIDAWYTRAGGIFGLFGFDPTNWNDFYQKMTVNPSPTFFVTYDPATFPTSATPYFNQKAQMWIASQPAPLGPIKFVGGA